MTTIILDTPEKKARFRAIIIRNGLQLYVASGGKIIPNRHLRPGVMMKLAMGLTAQRFRPRDYRGAIEALTRMLEPS